MREVIDSSLPVSRAKLTSPGIPHALAWGFAGSLLVLLGSVGVGWLPAVSVFNSVEPFIFLRTTIFGALLSTVLLTVGVWLMLYGWLMLGRALRKLSGQELNAGVIRSRSPLIGLSASEPFRLPDFPQNIYARLAQWLRDYWQQLRNSHWAPGATRVTNWAVALWSLPLLVAVPIYSRDMYAYVGQGRLVLNGGDPYSDGISSISNWFQLGSDSMWAEDGTPYGPVFIWFEALSVGAAGQSVEWAIFNLRLFAVMGLMLALIFTPLLARQHGIDPGRAQWLATANPLVLISYVASGHNDVIMVGLALGAVYFAIRRNGVLAVILLTLSVGIKPITIVLLPFIGMMWAGNGSSWAKKFLYWCYSGGIFLAIMTVIGMLNGYGFGWVKVMLGTGTGYTFWSPVGFIQMLLGNLGNAFSFDHDFLASVVKLAGRLSSVALVLILIFKGKDSQLTIRMTMAFTALVILSPVIHPWYLLWLLPFFAAIGIRDGWQLGWVVFTVAFLIGFGAYDQLHIWDFLGLGIIPNILSIAVTILMSLWLFVFNHRTRAFLDLKAIWKARATRQLVKSQQP